MNASQAARDFARENGVDLNEVIGTGSGGSITKPDVEKYLDEKNQG
ncbi:E3 binding domain-containing protein [Ignatzschineria indica]|uniref:Peripheral subunit-binding (PSBD) domain-containing protein n=1 Tax=Ignatzschineria indica TaxID=472583 RepID=A0A2U2AKC9_9GAMM|nr:hypothetical protein DC082_06465 [Ignatzschineria indica]